ncbi:CerR family C-terminal domain-containing protein [Aquabacterium sp. A7-Y]|uniref:CerR family C-terminal domain-containing protein n=1 Tax=Aquabacterium sp. A7-Y TaxID=1349605 RepID=UPI00223D26A0|nr:CerR family C-terminal domain-containing protein [Aquabacterium sp. A7-Y]MCW7541055.1 CerR family C-terminal domain-containing protein [Aquabacterium sp. A7-Y]
MPSTRRNTDLAANAPLPPRRTRPGRTQSAPPDGEVGRRGAAARQRLVAEATRIFAEKGYARASTREICLAAGVNVASIHYYFGDKEALYRVVLLEPIQEVIARLPPFDDEALSLEEAMRRMLGAFLMPLAEDGTMQHVVRIHLREMVEPTSMLRDVIEQYVVPHHQAMLRLLARHCGATRVDDGLHQLAFALTAIVQDYWLSRDWIDILAPGMLSRADALARVLDRLVGLSCAMVRHEAETRRGVSRGRRRSAAATSRRPPASKS